MKVFTVLAITGLVTVIGWVGYIYVITPRTFDMVALASDRNIRDVPPMKCESRWSSLESGGTLIAYVAYGKFRMHVSMVRAGRPVSFDIIGETGSPVFAWNSGSDKSIGPEEFMLPDRPEVRHAICSPWWGVDETVFQRPVGD